MKIAIISIATGKYVDLFDGLKNTLDKFLPGVEKTCFLFTDSDYQGDGVVVKRIMNLPWPLVTLLRFHYFDLIAAELADYDFVYYLDSDMIVHEELGNEILPEGGGIIAVTHPYWEDDKIGPFDHNRQSTAYSDGHYTNGLYCQACFFGACPKTFAKNVA